MAKKAGRPKAAPSHNLQVRLKPYLWIKLQAEAQRRALLTGRRCSELDVLRSLIEEFEEPGPELRGLYKEWSAIMKYQIEQARDGSISLLDVSGNFVTELVYRSSDESESEAAEAGLVPLFEKYSRDEIEIGDEIETPEELMVDK